MNEEERGSEVAVQSIERAARILRCFTRAQPALGVTEISRRVGLHKSTVSRLLTALRREGLVTQQPATGKYALGVALAHLASVALAGIHLPEVARQPMAALAIESGTTVSLVVLRGADCVDVHVAVGDHPVRVVRPVGLHLPTDATAAGDVYRAFAAGGEVGAGVRRAGYALLRGAWAPDVVELAAPVFDHRGEVAAVLVVSAPAYRLGHAEHEVPPDSEAAALLRALRVTAAEISAQLGYAPPEPVEA